MERVEGGKVLGACRGRESTWSVRMEGEYLESGRALEACIRREELEEGVWWG